MVLPEDAESLSHPEVWNERYSKSDGEHPTHEWFKSFDSLRPFLARNFLKARRPDEDPRILHLGSGDSTLPYDLAGLGYKNQLCVDFSDVVVKYMVSKQEKESGVEWKWADVRDMIGIPDDCTDVAFDKGTLDSMIFGSPWNPPDKVKENTSKYIREVFRVLKPDGVFLYITFRQPHFVVPLLNPDDAWDISVDVLREGEGCFDYHGFALRKKVAPCASPHG